MATTIKMNEAEKGIAILSYLSLGIVGFIWLIISSALKRKIRYYLTYHIYQSIFISVLLTLCYYFFLIIFYILSWIPKFEIIASGLNYFFTVKIFSFLGFEGTIVNLSVILVILYLIIGVLLSKNFFLPFITPTVQMIMKNYDN